MIHCLRADVKPTFPSPVRYISIKPFFYSSSVPVLLYLAEKYANFALFGKTIEDRAKVESILFWAVNSLGRYVFQIDLIPICLINHQSHKEV